MIADLTEIFDLIFSVLQNVHHIFSERFVFSVYGFTFSLWDFLLALFVLSCLVPLVVSPDFSGSFSNISGTIYRISERNDRKNYREHMQSYYDSRTEFYNSKTKFYDAKSEFYKSKKKR